MSEQVISPDLNFVRDIIASGGDDLKKCYQCATCTVVCDMTPGDRPFPRKEMLYAQWGLKDKLMGNPDVWLCHQCSDCTAYCPRGAKPGEVLGAIRKMSIKNYSAPGFLAEMVSDSKYFLPLLALPVVIFLAILAKEGNLSAFPAGEIVFSKFVPIHFIDPIFTAAAIFAAVSFFFGVKKHWADMSVNASPKGDVVATLKETVMEIIAHSRFKKCNVTKERSFAHLLVFYSFIGLAITTSWAVFYLYIMKRPSPYPLYDPLKILGNVSALALITGITLVLTNRMKNKEKAGSGSYFDWLFIIVIYVVAASGILSEVLRLADVAALAYPMYFIHLCFIFFLFFYAPFSKMAHMVYRTTAMVFARQTGREG